MWGLKRIKLIETECNNNCKELGVGGNIEILVKGYTFPIIR